jgi:hypothetical protein
MLRKLLILIAALKTVTILNVHLICPKQPSKNNGKQNVCISRLNEKMECMCHRQNEDQIISVNN